MPSVVAISLVKDEADIIERTVEWMMTQVDGIIMYDNGSTDGTVEILEGLPVELHHDQDPAHYQAKKITRNALRSGGDYVLSFDADEIWYSTNGGKIRDVFHSARSLVYSANMYEHVPTDLPGDHPFDRMAYRRREMNPLHKTVGKRHKRMMFDEGAHFIAYGQDRYPVPIEGKLEVRHFPYRSPSQFVSKVRNGYNGRRLAADLTDDVSPHLRHWGGILESKGEEALHEIYWTDLYKETSDPDLVKDPCPA